MEPLDAPRWRAWRTFLIFLVFLAVCALCVSVAAADPFVYLAHLGLNIHDADAFRSLALSALAIAVTAFWLTSILLDGLFRVGLASLLILAAWLFVRAVARLDSFWWSFWTVSLLTVVATVFFSTSIYEPGEIAKIQRLQGLPVPFERYFERLFVFGMVLFISGSCITLMLSFFPGVPSFEAIIEVAALAVIPLGVFCVAASIALKFIYKVLHQKSASVVYLARTCGRSMAGARYPDGELNMVPPNPLIISAAGLFVTSGLIILAGSIPPLPFAQPLRNAPFVSSAIGLRMVFSMVSPAIFLVSAIITAVGQLRADSEAWSEIQSPIWLVDPFKGPKLVIEVLRHVLAPFVFLINLVVRIERLTRAVCARLVSIIDQLIRKYLFRATIRVGKVVVGSWLILFGCNLLSRDIRLYLSAAGPFWSSLDQIVLAIQLLLAIVLCSGGVNLMTYWKHRNFQERDVAGKAVPFVFATYVVGLGCVIDVSLGNHLNLNGFTGFGLFTVCLPGIVGLIWASLVVRRYVARKRRLAAPN